MFAVEPRSDRTSGTCNQIRRMHFRVTLEIRDLRVLGNHNSKFGTD